MEVFVIGEKVSILEEAGVYTIKEILSGRVKIEDEFGFEQLIETKFVVKRRMISVHQIQPKDTNSTLSAKNKTKTDYI